jgi:invasion protein IalB
MEAGLRGEWSNMIESMTAVVALRRVGWGTLFAAIGLGFGTAPALAQATPAQQTPEPGNVSAWVKLCTKSEQIGNALVCVVKYEELNPKTGAVQLAAAVRSVEGNDQHQLLVNVPTNHSLVMPAGVRLKVDQNEPISLQYGVCLPTNCQVQTDLTKALLDQMRKGKVLLVAAISGQQKTLTFQIPLNGFSKTADGAPADTVKYQETRRRMLEFAKKTAEDQQKNVQPKGYVEPPVDSNVTVAPRKAAPASE